MNTPSDTYEFEAIGTHWWLERLDGGEFTKSIREALRAYSAEFDRRYSRFREDSLVIRLAQDGVLMNPPSEMIAMLDYAQELYEVSEGAFSPLVGNNLQALGYGKLYVKETNYGRTVLPSENQFDETGHKRETTRNRRSDLPKLGRRDIEWSEEEVRVPKGVLLDFGGLGKGWLIDEYARILRENGVKEYIVNGGGDVYVDSHEPVSFALEHPYDPTLKIGDVQITKGALAASSTVKRAWSNGDNKYHHIIDTKTGKSSNSDVVATFVEANSALVADSLATILIIRSDLEESLEKRYGAKALLVSRSNFVSS